MLAHNNAGVTAQPAVETEVCRWIADGYRYAIGFLATGTYSGEFTLYIDNEPWYVYNTSPGNRTAYVADRGFRLVAGQEVSLRVKHDDTSAQVFKGTILGGV